MNNKPVLFISHSFKDQDKVDILYDALKKFINIDDYHPIYTTHKEGSLSSGNNIAENTVLKVEKAAIFLAYISENFKNSPICMAELGVAYVKNKKQKGFKYLLIKDKYINFNNTTELGLGNIMMDANNPITIESEFNRIFNSKNNTIKVEQDLKIKFESIYNGYDYKLNVALSDVKVFLNKTFDVNHKLCEKPLILYVDRVIYEQLATELTSLAEERLLWTTFKSPLGIDKINLDKDFLTEYDRCFKKIFVNIKRRLIIFFEKSEENEYIKNTLRGDNKKRRDAFNDANKDILYYTTQQAIISAFNKNKQKQELIRINKKKDLYLEFAHMESRKIKLLYFSDFDNKTTSSTGIVDQPLIFINSDTSLKHIFEKKVSNSININKYISACFDDLLKNKIIKKI